MAKHSKRFISHYLEGIPKKVLKDHPHLINELIQGKPGIYGLYKNNQLVRVGLTKNLSSRLKNYLEWQGKRDWDTCNLYIPKSKMYLKTLESILIRMVKPALNDQKKGTIPGAKNLEPIYEEKKKGFLKEFDLKKHEMELTKKKKRRKTKKIGATHKKIALAPYIDPKKPFFKIYGTYNGKIYSALVLGNGIIKFDGKKYDTPSAVAKYVTGCSIDGWHFWKYKDPKTGELLPLDNLRRK